MENKLLSVIVPVYNTEKWLARCLDSILHQSYKNIELICVDDASPDGCGKILENYAAIDSRVKVVKHKKNRGLFRARVTGLNAANGAYIAFVDSDDSVSCDWFRPLIKKAEKEDADMVLGNTINVDENGVKTYYNYYRSFNRNRQALVAPQLADAFFEQSGECFIWHTVWNKVYSADLIKKAMPYFDAMPEPLIMGEDIAFSSVFYSLANKLAFCDNDCYFYCRHSQASTSVTLPKEKIIKNLKDIICVFDFVRNFLVSVHKFDEQRERYARFKDKYYIIWSGNIVAAKLENNPVVKTLLCEGFGESSLKLPAKGEFYFYGASSIWDDGLEKIKCAIIESNCKYVSFDVFDTLLIRPFWEPSDIFRAPIMDNSIPAYFSTMRRISEENCRKVMNFSDRKKEDVTLSEIYAYMAEKFGIGEEEIAYMQASEIANEYKFCSARKTGKDLFDLVLSLGKHVVLISDMYLDENDVRKMLAGSGYFGYDKIFMSSSCRKLKSTGSLYGEVLTALGISAGDIVHIGDNLHNDIENAKKNGIRALYLPKAVDVFCNRVNGAYTGNAFKDIYCGMNAEIDSREFIKQMSLRCAEAVVANNMFDNPFRSFNNKSNYNADPYYIGYMAVGMHVFGVAKWIYDTAVERGYDNIVFLARDGYLVKQVFDQISEVMAKRTGKAISSSYFYATRRALCPLMMRTAGDLLRLVDMTDYCAQTPADILEWLDDCCNELNTERAKQYIDAGFDLKRKFRDFEDFVRFLSTMAKISFDPDKSNANRAQISPAFKKVFSGKCAAFDLGYSGRLQAIISDLAEKPVDVFYIHDNGDRTSQIAAAAHYKKYCFYDFSPCITGIVREIFLSELSPSCIGYSICNGELSYIFDEGHRVTYGERYAIEESQRGALDFCTDMLASFGDQIGDFTYRAADISVAFENFFYNATDFDFSVFKNTLIEDKVFGGYDQRSLYETLEWHSNMRVEAEKAYVGKYIAPPFKPKTRLGRVVFYFLFDRKTFFAKVKAKLKRIFKKS